MTVTAPTPLDPVVRRVLLSRAYRRVGPGFPLPFQPPLARGVPRPAPPTGLAAVGIRASSTRW